MDRDSLIANVLPRIKLDIPENSSEIEVFMHKVLRPILKFQNRVIMHLMENEPHFRHMKWLDIENSKISSKL